MNATGTGQAFNFGAAMQASGNVTLAATANTITTNTINIGVTTSNGGVDTLNLGAGTNVLNASNIVIGSGKGIGIVKFAGSTGSVTIAGTTGGASTANITIGNSSTGTAGSGNSTLSLAGRPATVQAGTMIVGQLAGATAGSPTGAITFDTGSMTIDNLQIANNSSGNATNGVQGSFTLGTDQTSTGVLTVNTQFTLANQANTAAASVAKGTFIINGGVANINTNIEVDMASGALGTTNTTLQLATGTLNMNGHEIGPVSGTSVAINTVTLPGTGHSATLANLGGGGINSAGLTMNGLGTLNLGGANTYSGGTNVNAGTLAVVGSITDTNIAVASSATFAVNAGGSISSTSVISNNGTVVLNNAQNTISSLTNAAGALVKLGGTAVKTSTYVESGGLGAWTSGMDIGVSKFILESSNKTSDLAQLRDEVSFGKTNAPNGIFSTTLPGNFGIAVVDNAVVGNATFGGIAVDSNSVMVAAEFLGDANVDGHVDLTDLSTVLNNFGASTRAWTSGNFDGAPTIDLTDLSDVLNNFGASNPNASDGGVGAAIVTPEPASLAVLGLGTLGMLSRRRSSRR